MSDYEILGLMDTFKAIRGAGIQGVPDTFTEFLAGIQPVSGTPEPLKLEAEGDSN